VTGSVDLYDTAYAKGAQHAYQEVRRATYDVDLGQTGWMTAAELDSFAEYLELASGSHTLEVGCGAGGCAVHLASTTGASITGIDVNESGVRAADTLSTAAGLAGCLAFVRADAGKPLPFRDCSFTSLFSNDAVCHIPDRLQMFEEWMRVLKPGARILFTDALVVTGLLSKTEIATRSCIGNYFFVPPGENERLTRQAGFEVLHSLDTTQSAAGISKRWLEARDLWRNELIPFEGEENYNGLQDFLSCVYTVSRERRLSRFLYVARKPAEL
jgi:ubiquinone/menaquinone biosynthesis C-methylase UbiE